MYLSNLYKILRDFRYAKGASWHKVMRLYHYSFPKKFWSEKIFFSHKKKFSKMLEFCCFFKEKIFWPWILKKRKMVKVPKMLSELQICTRTAKKIFRHLRAREVPLSKILGGGGKSWDSPPPQRVNVRFKSIC